MYNPPYAPNPSEAPAPPPPPPPEEAEGTPSGPRYPYLISRLRNRQITMEEATELFGIQRQQVSILLARTNALAAAAAVSARPPRVAPPAPRPTPTGPAAVSALENLDLWGEGLLFLALGAGVLAALVKRSQGPAPTAPSPPTTPASGSRRK